MVQATEFIKVGDFLTIKEVARDFFSSKISAPSIYRLVESGEIPAVRVGGKLLIRRSVLKSKYGGSP